MWRDTSHPEGGGSELFVERVAEHLVAAYGWDVTICCAAHKNSPPDEMRNGTRVRRRGGALTVYLHGLAYLLSRTGRGTDVVVDVQNGIPFFTPLARRHGIVNLVHHVHREQWQMIYPGPVGRTGWWIESRLAPWLYRRHRYVTVSDSTRQDLDALGVASERIDLVYNGIDVPLPDHFVPKSTNPTICVLGRLVPHKQVEHALVVAAELRKTIPRLEVEVIGGGWWQGRLEECARELGVDDIVRFHGMISDGERDAVLDRSWVLLAPSVKEGWGIAIMEAAARGVPAVAYRTAGGVCESIVDGSTGWLVEDMTDLTKRAEELLRDTELRDSMGNAARSRAIGFSWPEAGARFAQIVERAAD